MLPYCILFLLLVSNLYYMHRPMRLLLGIQHPAKTVALLLLMKVEASHAPRLTTYIPTATRQTGIPTYHFFFFLFLRCWPLGLFLASTLLFFSSFCLFPPDIDMCSIPSINDLVDPETEKLFICEEIRFTE